MRYRPGSEYRPRVALINASFPNLEKYRFASKSAQLLNGLLSMSLAHNWLDETVLLMNLVQNVVQATPIADRTTAELLQLPGMNAGRVQALRKAHKLAAYGIQGFWNIPDAERKKTLEVGNKGLGQSEYDQMVRVAGEWPRLEMVDAFFKGEQAMQRSLNARSSRC